MGLRRDAVLRRPRGVLVPLRAQRGRQDEGGQQGGGTEHEKSSWVGCRTWEAGMLEKYSAGRDLSAPMSDAITLELLHADARTPERATEDSAGYDLFVHLTHRTVSCSDSAT